MSFRPVSFTGNNFGILWTFNFNVFKINVELHILKLIPAVNFFPMNHNFENFMRKMVCVFSIPQKSSDTFTDLLINFVTDLVFNLVQVFLQLLNS
jgi:hypothetical protein